MLPRILLLQKDKRVDNDEEQQIIHLPSKTSSQIDPDLEFQAEQCQHNAHQIQVKPTPERGVAMQRQKF